MPKRRPRADSGLSDLSLKLFLLNTQIATLAHDSLLEILLGLTVLQEFVVVKKKIEGLASRVASMDALFEAPPGDVAELRRRDGVIWYGAIPHSRWVLTPSSEFKGIEGQLRSLSREPGPQWLIDHAQQDEEVFVLLEDLREAIFRYQVCSWNATFSNSNEYTRWCNRKELAARESNR